MQVTITHEFNPVIAKLTAFYQRVNGDLTPVLNGIGVILENSTRKRFETKTDPDGEKWADWKESTKKQRASYANKYATKKNKAKDLMGELMIDTRNLLDSITHHATNHSVAVGTNQQYAVHHQFGTKHMPARPIFGISAEDEGDIIAHLTDYFAEGLDG